MKVNDIRKKYLDFFQAKKHRLVASDSLVPQNDPSLLFTGAGMNQFKEYFLGIKKDMMRATTSQKCLRTGDLEEVGRTAFHHSFFEMLGNFSFGDYFKREAITWAWEFLTEELKISKDQLRVSVHNSDDEAYKIWKDKIGIRPDWIYKMGDKSNFWPANAPKDGPNGPCGPCSEIYYDQAPEKGEKGDLEDGDRFAEIWNLVFTQFDRQEGGKLEPLKQKNIDTGMGLERLACVLQGKETNYEIDSFQPIHETIEKRLGVKVPEKARRSLYAISDHVRGIVFCIADGALPSNEGRGYVVRKLIRRALWHAHQIHPKQKIEKPFLYEVIPTVVSVMKAGYPELKEAQASIASSLKEEEQRFLEALENGLKILNDKIKAVKNKTLPGKVVFELYDTYGFPDELTRMIAESKGLKIDQKEFESLMDKQRKQAKQASQMSDEIFTSSDLEKKVANLPETEFLGYDKLNGKAKVLFIELKDEKGVVVLDKSPFYAESGGQVGDQGMLQSGGFQARVIDTQKKDKVFLHYVELLKGTIDVGESVQGLVNARRRHSIMRNHTATHILHSALRNILGEQVRQLGSLVAEDRLRFDYSHSKPLTPEQIKEIENSVNDQVLKDTEVSKEEKETEEAKTDGAIAFFGEKYDKRVRVVTVPGFSKEFCGGTHCERTGQIGAFIITSDSSIASGTRRIEALTGEGAIEYVRKLRSQMGSLSQALKTTPDQLGEKVSKLQENVKKLEKERNQAKVATVDSKQILKESKKAGIYRFATFVSKEMEIKELRFLSDDIRSKSSNTVFFLGSEKGEKIQFILGTSPDLGKSDVDVRNLGKELSSILGATGGGRKDMIQGGGPNKGQLHRQLDQIQDRAVNFLKELNGN